MLGRLNAHKVIFNMAKLFGRTVLFTPALVDRTTVPKGMRMYEIRTNEIGEPCKLAHSFAGIKYGTIITNRYFALNIGYRTIRRKDFVVHKNERCTLKEFIHKYPPKKKSRQMFGQ